jgi:hypothetical protein
MQDKFGNPLYFKQQSDGKVEKSTTIKWNKFEFLGDEYSTSLLENNEVLKTYYTSSDSEAALQRDSFGRLWLYFYDEYKGEHDRTDILWTLVENEADADKMVTVARLSRLRIPFVGSDDCGWWGATEWGAENKQ